ncbi:MAG: PulJ/GspJ family protein [Gallionella sp.]
MRSSSNQNNSNPAGKHTGFTLIELLVAISVLGVIAVLGWRGLDSIVRTRITLTSDLEQTRGMQLTFAQLQSDCAHLASPYMLPNRVPLIAVQDQLTLIRTVFADNQPTLLQVISYRVQDGVLTRRESVATRDLRQLDTLWQSAKNNTDTSPAVALQSGVAAMTMRFWVNGGNAWLTNLGIVTPPPVVPGSAPGPALLTGLEITMQLRGRNTGLLKVFLLGAV